MARKLCLKEFLQDDTLDLSMNDLQDVPVKEIAALPKATSLDLSNNKLTSLSRSFATSLTHLVKLDLARNDLRELPINFGCLINLKHLDLYKNKIETLPLSFANLKALRWLDIKDNPLEPHWRHIVGPCLNAQDCKTAAKNVVNIASMMNEEISAEVQRSQARQKLIEENELREQAKKREKQKEKKKRKNAAKLAEMNHREVVENGSLSEVEQMPTDIDDLCETPVTIDDPINFGAKLKSMLSAVMWSAVFCLVLFLLCLLIMGFVNEPMYQWIMLRLNSYSQSAMATLPGSVRVSWHKFSTRIFNNGRYVGNYIVSACHLLYKSIINAYIFSITDPKVDLYLNSVLDHFLSFYVYTCKYASMFFNTVTQVHIS